MVPYGYVTTYSSLIHENRGLSNLDEAILIEKKCSCRPVGIIVHVYITIVLESKLNKKKHCYVFRAE